MKNQHILMISYHTCPLASSEGKESGGMNVYVYELCCQLAKMGYKVDAVTHLQDLKEDIKVRVCPGFRVIHLKAGPAKPVNKKMLVGYIPEFANSIYEFMHKENLDYDIIDAHYYQSGLAALELNRKTDRKKPLVMTFHTLGLMKNLVARSVREQESEERIVSELKLIKEADLIISPSINDKLYLKYLYDADTEKINIIPPGVNKDIFKPQEKKSSRRKTGIDPDTKVLMFVGRIEPLKGIDMIMYALKILASKMPDTKLKLLIVGGDISQHIKNWSPVLKQLNKIRQKLDISDYIDFVGQKQQKVLADYYNSADIVLMPSHYESFGMTALEAMACGIPVVTTNATGVADLIGIKSKNLITGINNPLLLASQIQKLLIDKKTYLAARDNALQATSGFSWKATASEISGLYQKLLNN